MNNTINTPAKKLTLNKETVRQLTAIEGMNKQFATTLMCSYGC